MTDIVYTNKCGDIRQVSLMSNGLEGNQGIFCPCFIGYYVGKAYINNFKQDHILLRLFSLLSILPRYIIIYRIV